MFNIPPQSLYCIRCDVLTVLVCHVGKNIICLFISGNCESLEQHSLLLAFRIKSKLNDKNQMSPIANKQQRMTIPRPNKGDLYIYMKQEERKWHSGLCLIPGHVQLASLTSPFRRFSWIKTKIQAKAPYNDFKNRASMRPPAQKIEIYICKMRSPERAQKPRRKEQGMQMKSMRNVVVTKS